MKIILYLTFRSNLYNYKIVQKMIEAHKYKRHDFCLIDIIL